LTNERSFSYAACVKAKAVARAGRAGAPAALGGALPTREAILDAAERLFSARGADGVAVRDLARELGLTPSSLYNHFPSKQALYDAVLERGLRPIVELMGEGVRADGLDLDQVRTTVDRLVAHLETHPHLGRLLQRALLEEDGGVQALVARWLAPLYLQGTLVVRRAAADAGWSPAEVPHLALGLFGMVFAYFTNAGAVTQLTGGQDGGLSAASLAVQRRFLEAAIYRLLGPQAGAPARGRRAGKRT
jgi:AcrR family transcriptional regulator